MTLDVQAQRRAVIEANLKQAEAQLVEVQQRVAFLRAWLADLADPPVTSP